MTAEDIKAFQYRPDVLLGEGIQIRRILESMFGLRRPSDIVDVMRSGLREHSQRIDFKIAMHTFGAALDGTVCFGCAATATLGTLMPAPFCASDGSDSRWLHRLARDNSHHVALMWVEDFFNDVRRGTKHTWESWLETGDLSQELQDDFKYLPMLLTNDWEEHLPKYEDWAQQARAAGY